MSKRRTFSREFKIEAVQMVLNHNRSIAEVARSLGIRDTVLRNWVKQFKEQGQQAFPGKGHLSPTEQELHHLRLENKRLRAECDILKKAAAFFAKEAL